MLTRGDFHIHSTASDGELSPKEIITTAKSRGIDVVAITDHNTTDGIKEAAAAGKTLGVSVIPAVELSTKFNSESIHVLGYFKNSGFSSPYFKEILKHVKSHNINKARALLNGIIITENAGNHLTVFEGIQLLKRFGAAAVLAHPVFINDKNLSDIIMLPFVGIEAKYCHNTEYDTAYFIKMASERFAFYTGGSDYHTNKTRYLRRCMIGEPYLNSKEIQMFLKKSGAAILI